MESPILMVNITKTAISVGDYIPNSWIMFNWDIYQPQLDLYFDGEQPSFFTMLCRAFRGCPWGFTLTAPCGSSPKFTVDAFFANQRHMTVYNISINIYIYNIISLVYIYIYIYICIYIYIMYVYIYTHNINIIYILMNCGYSTPPFQETSI